MGDQIDVFKNDDSNSFGRCLARIRLKDFENIVITKAVISCGNIVKEYPNPIFPLDVNLSSSETRKLNYNNYLYISIFDYLGRKHTFTKSFCINAKDEVVPTSQNDIATNPEEISTTNNLIEIENDLTTPIIDITIDFNVNPEKLSQLEDDIQVEQRFTTIINEIEGIKDSENREINNIISMLEQRAENTIDLNTETGD